LFPLPPIFQSRDFGNSADFFSGINPGMSISNPETQNPDFRPFSFEIAQLFRFMPKQLHFLI
jgi:hypothetical protein